MNKIITNRTFAAAAFGAAALFSMMAMGGSAQASNVLNCKGSTAGQVAACCEHLIEKKGTPLWMMQTETSCHEAVVCRRGSVNTVGAVAINRCYMRSVELILDGGDNKSGRSRSRAK